MVKNTSGGTVVVLCTKKRKADEPPSCGGTLITQISIKYKTMLLLKKICIDNSITTGMHWEFLYKYILC